MKYLTTIWDSHIHMFTEEMSSDPKAWADEHHELVWKSCVAPPDRPSIQGWADVDQLLRDMDTAGIETAILQGWYWENMENCFLQNRFYLDIISKHSDRLKAFATIQPKHEKASEEIDWARDHGFSGIGEIHPQAQGASLEDSCWHSILEQISDWNFPINFHVTDPETQDHPGKIDTPLVDYLELAKKWPDQIFILAHLGALIPLRPELKDLSQGLENLYYDCAAIPLLYESSVIDDIVKVVGANKVLFGSDYPLRVAPRIQKRPDFIPSKDYVYGSGLTDDELETVFSTNAKRLFTVGQ